MKKSIKDQTARAFQVGGYNPPSVPKQPYAQPTQVNPQTGTYTLPGTGIAGYQVPGGGQTGYTPYGGAAPYFQPVQFTGPQFQTSLQTTNLPTFAETVGSKPGQYDELRTYINDAGQTLQIPFKDGKPIYPIPEGYRPIGDQPKAEQPTTVTPTLGQVQVRDEGGGGMEKDTVSVKGQGIFSGTTFGNPSKASQAVTDAYGITGQRGVNVGAIASIVALNPLGALASVSGFGPSIMAFGKEPTVGMLGTMSKSELEAVAKGFTLEGFGVPAMSQEQAQNALDAAAVIGVDVSQMGHFGFQPGDAVPGMPGAFMDKTGMARNVKTGAIARSQSGSVVYSDIKSMISRLSMTQEEKNAEDLRANMEAVSAEMGRQGSAAEARNAARDAKAGRDSSDRSGSTGKGEAKSGGSLADSGTSGKGYSGYGSGFQGPHGTGAAPSSGSTSSSSSQEQAAPATRSLGRSPGEMAARSGGGPDGPTGGGGGAGSAGSSGQGCFAAGTMFFMEDGSLKAVEDIKVGDTMMHGGKVRLSIIGDGSETDWYMYGTTKVTGSHAVRENGEWKYVRYSENAIPTETEELLYTVTNENHRMISEDKIVYADYDMVDEDGIEEELLEMLNEQDVVKKAA